MKVIHQPYKVISPDRFLSGTAGCLLFLTIISALGLSSTVARADNRVQSVNASVTVSSTCSMTGTVTSAHTATMVNGQYKTDGIGSTTLKVLCNDYNGFAIYAIGYTDNVDGRTYLTDSNLGSTYNINTGTTLDGTVSSWAMKLAAVSSANYTPSITNSFDSFQAVPTSYTRVAQLNKATDIYDATSSPNPEGSSVTTTYAASISPTQPAGTYVGQVKYILVHPYTASEAMYTERYLQDVAQWGGTLLVGDTTTAVDNRDGKTYTVARLCMKAGGGCDTTSADTANSKLWIVQNMEIDLSDTSITFTNANTNITTDAGTDAGYSTDGSTITWTPSVGTGRVVNYAGSNPANSVTGWSNTYTAPYQALPGDGKDHYMYKGAVKYPTDAGVECAAAHSVDECRPYRVGYYYNWSAAVAMNATGSYTADQTVMPNSICPAGWRLPEGLTAANVSAGTGSEYNQLLNSYGLAGGTDTTGSVNVGWASGGLNTFESKPFYFARSGYVNVTTLYNYANYGYYWSSTVYSSSYAYYLLYDSGGLYPAGRGYRYVGGSVRCVAQ